MWQSNWQTAMMGALVGLSAVALSLPMLALTQELGALLPVPHCYAVSVIADALLAYAPMWLLLAWFSYRLVTLEAGAWMLVGSAAAAYLALPLLVGSHWYLASWIWSQPSALMAQLLGVSLGQWLARR
ncbi:hypothetical protein FCL40_02885 [Ferrimonas sediminicola]|uniref:Uncharacterized protein n=1 Tax=Ferrimonas sediminicola TaxID=2569538 RepID=A0A4U1BK02_9GAMM|nr:hypothetical protein [Ferrimonas sediminicola]TKB51515.1 hypothetical protein FCL40_02885 [Ferrimonas sediminicola]